MSCSVLLAFTGIFTFLVSWPSVCFMNAKIRGVVWPLTIESETNLVLSRSTHILCTPPVPSQVTLLFGVSLQVRWSPALLTGYIVLAGCYPCHMQALVILTNIVS